MSSLVTAATLRVLPFPPTRSALLLRLLPTATGGRRGLRLGPPSPFTSCSTKPATRVQFPTVAKTSFCSTSPPPPAGRRGDAWAVGDRAEMRRVFTARDVADFARLTGDTNPVHGATAADASGGGVNASGAGGGVDAAGARDRPLVHGVLLLGLVSALLGTRLPGAGCVLATARLRFPAPLLAGDEASASATVLRARAGSLLLRVMCTTVTAEQSARPHPVGSGGAAAVVVLEGEVLVMLPPRDPAR